MIRTLNDIAGLSVTVMGLGLNGGGLASARFFAEHGAREVIVTDMKTEAELAPSVQALRKYSNIHFVLGEHRQEDFRTADVVIKNPGVKAEGNPYLAVARRIETDISIFLQLTQAPVIAVTGSKGKSSTVSAMYYGLTHSGVPAFLGGNITVSPLSFLTETSADTPVVLELSSWQLGDLAHCPQFKPKIAVLTPIMPDHQNWYGSMERYVADKKIIYCNQEKTDYTICNYDDGWGAAFASETRAQVFWYSTRPLPRHLCGAWVADDGSVRLRLQPDTETALLPACLNVPGAILKQNVMTAALALTVYGLEPLSLFRTLPAYKGIAHRLEFFHQYGVLKFYNDSAATIPEAVAAAIQAFDAPVLLLAGGTDKNSDFTPLIPHLHKVSSLFLLAGTATDKLLPLLHNAGIKYSGPFNSLDDMLDALRNSTVCTEEHCIVFSPGAASFGMFKNEFDRGNRFKAGVVQRWQLPRN